MTGKIRDEEFAVLGKHMKTYEKKLFGRNKNEERYLENMKIYLGFDIFT